MLILVYNRQKMRINMFLFCRYVATVAQNEQTNTKRLQTVTTTPDSTKSYILLSILY